METQRFGRRSGACISKIMHFARRFREALARHEGVGWFAIHLQYDRALQHIDEPRCRMNMATRSTAGGDVRDPKIPAIRCRLICSDKIRALYRRLLSMRANCCGNAYCAQSRYQQRQFGSGFCNNNPFSLELSPSFDCVEAPTQRSQVLQAKGSYQRCFLFGCPNSITPYLLGVLLKLKIFGPGFWLRRNNH